MAQPDLLFLWYKFVLNFIDIRATAFAAHQRYRSTFMVVDYQRVHVESTTGRVLASSETPNPLNGTGIVLARSVR